MTAATSRYPFGVPAPKLTRRHFYFVAEIIRELPVGVRQRKKIAEKFAGQLMRTNHQFKYHRFVDACLGV